MVHSEAHVALLGEQGYEVLAHLGSGGHGDVFKVMDVRLGTVYAIKTLRDNSDQKYRRFQQEARFAARLDHPNIAKSLKFGLSSGFTYIVYEFVEGWSLAEMLQARKSIDVDLVLSISLQLLSALSAAHGNGILHRDIKPSNILLDQDLQVKLLDFGIGLLEDSQSEQRITNTNQFIGTLAYTSPEGLAGHRLDQRSDLYSVGCVMYEMLVGNKRFQDILGGPRASESSVCGHDLMDIVLRLLEKNPGDRFPNAQAVVEALREVATDKPASRKNLVNDKTLLAGLTIGVAVLFYCLSWALVSLQNCNPLLFRNCAELAMRWHQTDTAIFFLEGASRKAISRLQQANDHLTIAQLQKAQGREVESQRNLKLGFTELAKEYALLDDGHEKSLLSARIADLYVRSQVVRRSGALNVLDALMRAANDRSKSGDHKTAYQLWKTALMHDRQFNGNRQAGDINTQLAVQAALLGAHDDSASLFAAALSNISAPADRVGISVHLADEYIQSHRPKLALETIEAAFRDLLVAREIGYRVRDLSIRETQLLVLKIRSNLNLGKLAEAKRVAKKLLVLAEEENNDSWAAESYGMMAQIAIRERKFVDVLQYLERSRDRYKSAGRPDEADKTDRAVRSWRPRALPCR